MPARSEPSGAGRGIFLHGFTQTHHHWHRCGSLIAERCGFASSSYVDLPGHGLSTADRSDIVATARALPSLAGPGTYVGYSMGGRVALLAAAGDTAGLVERLVLIGATAGLPTEDEREERRRLDGERADRLLDLGVEAFLDEWLAAPLFATLAPDPSGRERRARNDPDGLAHSLRHHGTGSQPSLWDQLGEIEVPTLVIAGALDPKFIGIGQRMVDGLPNAQFVSIAGAGHAAHSERPEAVADAVAAWIAAQR
jgi:2-succinyl-6-hydroxy-2,4-cyclohexadiene-1-carboxylate synthase